MAEASRVVGRFDDFGAFVRALHKLRESKFARYQAYGPTSLADLEDLMPRKGSPVRIWTTAGAIAGLVTFFLMCGVSSLIYSLIVGGKPPLSNVPFVVITYEGTILTGGITAMIAVLVYAYLRPVETLPEDFNTSFTGDSYGIEVNCDPGERDEVNGLLTSAGAVEVYENNQR